MNLSRMSVCSCNMFNISSEGALNFLPALPQLNKVDLRPSSCLSDLNSSFKQEQLCKHIIIPLHAVKNHDLISEMLQLEQPPVSARLKIIRS